MNRLAPEQIRRQKEAAWVIGTSIAAALLIGAWIYAAVWHGTSRLLG